jgi:CDP-diacylglycerol--serine O-phosphatidyltransferase
MNIAKYVPNTITCFNLVSGCAACVAALEGNLFLAAMFVILAAVFDFLDGFAARLMHAYSPIGKELDGRCGELRSCPRDGGVLVAQ